MIDIIIRESTTGPGWDVIQGDKMADSVTYEEMLGLVSALTMPKERRCLSWMWTEEERKDWHERLRQMAKDNNTN